MNSSSNNTSNWFYIKHVATNKVISTCRACDTRLPHDYVRSQVVVTKQEFTDNELWCWDDNYLRNKSTGLVLDIRNGRLRLIEDTDVCLFYKKPYDMSQNQLWAVRPAAGSEQTATEHPLFKKVKSTTSPAGNVIYSICNSDWVLDICSSGEIELEEDQHKLILFPQHQNSNATQRWEFVQETDALTTTTEPGLLFEDNLNDSCITDDSSTGYTSGASSISCESIGFAHGLTPAKRSSQSSLSSMNRKESLEDCCTYQSYQHYTIFN